MFAKYISEIERFAFSDTDNGGIEISHEYYNELFYGQTQGRAIVPDATGYPVNAVPTLLDMRGEKRIEIETACKAAIIGGINYGGYYYPTSPNDQANLNGLISKSILLGDTGEPYKFWCADADGVWARRDHSAAQIQAIGLAVAAHVIAAQDLYETKLAAINAAATQADLDLIAWA